MSAQPSPTVCLVTPAHLAMNPRIVKEAEALTDAGIPTHIVHASFNPAQEKFDAEIARGAGWTRSVVSSARSGDIGRRLIRTAARTALRFKPFANLANATRTRRTNLPGLVDAAVAVRAPLYLGHCLSALPVVARAAAQTNARFGFDAEDFHDWETTFAMEDAAERAATRILQQTLLPRCHHFTAAAPLIAQQYRISYNVLPTVVLNVFPRREAPRPGLTPLPITSDRPAKLYWFSQTIGPGRGIEAAIRIIAAMRTPAELHLRGSCAAWYASHLAEEARRAGLTRPIVFHAPAPAAEMARQAAQFDLGLSTEQTDPPNRDLCLTNKVFTYLLAGIPQLLSMTQAQTQLAPKLGSAAILSDLDDPTTTARRLDDFFASSTGVQDARSTASRLANDRYCWDIEKEIFLASVRRALG